MRPRLPAAALLLLVAGLASAAPPSTYRVGSKAFTESVLLGELVTQLLAADGLRAEHRRELGGTQVLWKALVAGELDVYPEYTGTLREEIFPGFSGDEAQLRQRLAGQGIGISAPLGFEDGYALGVRAALAQQLSLHSLSDLAAHPELRLGLSNEFMDRADGWRSLQRAYGLNPRDVRGLDHELAYRALRQGALDGTDVYTTDAEIAASHLVLLRDDRHHFPGYQAVLLYRLAAAKADARLLPALRTLEGRIDTERMRALNARVKLDHQTEADVAASFLREALSRVTTPARETRWTRLLARTREHLFLVSISLLLALLLALPLGVLSARRPRVGAVVLGLTSVVQTLPSLALLVFMIPLFGIGARPAIAALFLYSLLPIVRNTYTGLLGIPLELRESADALGLGPWSRLWRIDLPLARPSILAGIKTAAVINVGTATLGALIGAGGYGQPVLTGIRLASVELILEGAVPAAVLALLVQGGFNLLERGLVRRRSTRPGPQRGVPTPG